MDLCGTRLTTTARNKLHDELSSVYAFFQKLTGIKMSMPGIKKSSGENDAAWYSYDTIFINPDYNPENLGIGEMVAHEFLHYTQDMLFWKRLRRPFGKKATERIGEFFEGAAFLFAAAYVNRDSQRPKKRVLEYMTRKEHMTRSGIGNRQVLAMFENKRIPIRKAVRDSLRYDHIIKVCMTGRMPR